MNIAVTEGVRLMPPAFRAGLGLWSSGDGTPGSADYGRDPRAWLVAPGALCLRKTEPVQHLRAMIETPILPGCYLQVTARLRALNGPRPQVRIAGWAGKAGGGAADVAVTCGPAVPLLPEAQETTISAIVGTGQRNGVDLVWTGAAYGHFGIDLTGPVGGTVEVAEIAITDISGSFAHSSLPVVDVRDFGAQGDGSTDDTTAFQAADAAAEGRQILVPEGDYHLGHDLRLRHRLWCIGRVSQASGQVCQLRDDGQIFAYTDAFADPQVAFAKGFQALVLSDAISLDLGGQCIDLSAPLDLSALWRGPQHKVVRNGTLRAVPGPGWERAGYRPLIEFTREAELDGLVFQDVVFDGGEIATLPVIGDPAARLRDCALVRIAARGRVAH